MNFITWQFLLFLLVVLSLFTGVSPKYRTWLLLLASYVFYATWSVGFISIILLTTSVDYFLSHAIHKRTSPLQRKALLITGLTLNIAVLASFKYFNFLLDNCNGLIHLLNPHATLPEAFNIILPLGISFYTFEAISYLVDVYRGSAPAKSWWSYNFYIMYFPHLISGPIVRFEELWGQYKQALQRPSLERVAQAVELILLGYIFKVMIADPVSHWVDPVFDLPTGKSSLLTYIAVLGFTVQIYFDFMGYTHIARGVSLLFNIELPLNFNHPYVANNISNFWNRWHISLSRWIRDYLYIPLGGSGGSLPTTITNLMATMLIAGFWHGAGWSFILWGGYHGLLLGIYHGLKPLTPILLSPFRQIPSVLKHTGAIALTFISVAFGWVLFRSPSPEIAFALYKKLFDFPDLLKSCVRSLELGDSIPLLQIAFLLSCCFTGPWLIRWVQSLYRSLPFWLKAQTVCVMVFVLWFLTSQEQQPFIYFQF